MKEKILLLLSFIFSLILFTFSADNTLAFLNVKILFSLTDFAGLYSPESYVSTAFIGYVFLLLFSLLLWKKSNNKNLLLVLVILSILGFLFELNSIFKALSNSYTGQHLRIGIALSLLGLFILNESSKSPSKLNSWCNIFNEEATNKYNFKLLAMGFGGSVAGMIVSLKNNKRNRKSAFEKLERFQKEGNDKLHFENSASTEDLLKIRLKLKKENKIRLIKNCILFVIGFFILYYVIGFVNF